MGRIRFKVSITETPNSKEKYSVKFPVGRDGNQSQSLAIIWKNSLMSEIEDTIEPQFIECDEDDHFTIVRGNGMSNTTTFKQFYDSNAKGYTGQTTQASTTGITYVAS